MQSLQLATDVLTTSPHPLPVLLQESYVLMVGLVQPGDAFHQRIDIALYEHKNIILETATVSNIKNWCGYWGFRIWGWVYLKS